MTEKENIRRVLLVLSICLCLVLCGCGNSPKSVKPASKEETQKSDEAIKAEEPQTEAESASNSANDENTYEHNAYYDVVETSSFKDRFDTIVIDKVLAKQDVSVSASVIVYSPNGDVIEKSSDEITLTKGEYNFFRYEFENDISDATLEETARIKEDSFMSGERNGVELVKYNQVGDNLYLTLEQKTDALGSFAKFKILFYKNDTIVDTDYSYFDVCAQNLGEKGSTDVAEIWVYGIDYDRIEYIFEP